VLQQRLEATLLTAQASGSRLQEGTDALRERVLTLEGSLAEEQSKHRVDVKELERMQGSMLTELADRNSQLQSAQLQLGSVREKQVPRALCCCRN
jgi:hypothetical protein